MGKKDKAGKKGENEDVKRDQKLQAILMAVSFTKYFRPISYIKPKVMLPLVNVPMLTYTIEFLAQNGVEEIFVFCVRHADLIQNFINGLKLPSNITVKCIFSRACLSQGDALRELDALGVIRSDPFILINGDVISNMDLKRAIAFHKSRRKEDSNCIMTVTLRQVQHQGAVGVRPLSDDLVVAMDRNSSQLLLFDSSVAERAVSIPAEIFASHPCLDIRTDLLDCQIDICSPELLLQFSDNFDYQDIRRHFVRNEVVNWELGEHLYGYVIQDEYAASVSDPRTYHAICRDIVRRWVYPIVPDAHLLMDTTYTPGRRHNYREDGVKVARSARVGPGVVLGRGAVVHDNAVISHCVIGRNCVVGEGAVLRESHLWEGVNVEAGAVVTFAIVGENSIIKTGAVIERGCILSSNVVVGAGVVLKEYTRVGSCRHPDEELSEGEDDEDDSSDPSHQGTSAREEKGFHTAELGPDGKGFIWKFGDEVGDEFGLDDSDEEEEDDASHHKPYLLPGGREAAFKASNMGCQEQEDWKRALWSVADVVLEESDDETLGSMGANGEFRDGEAYERFDTAMMGADGSGEEVDVNVATQQRDPSNESFIRVVGDMVSTGYAEGHPADNLLMEIKGYKFAQNKEFSDCINGAVPSLLAVVMSQQPTGSSDVKLVINALRGMFGEDKWGNQLLTALIQDTDDRVCLIESVEDWVTTVGGESHILFSSFRFVLQIFYDEDLLDDDSLLEWADMRESDRGDALRVKLFSQPTVQQFVTWVREQDEEDDSEEGEDSSDEDDA